MQETSPGIVVPARKVATPAHLSREAQDFIAMAAQRPRLTPADDADAAWWDEASRQWEERILPQIEPFFMPELVTIETLTLGDALCYEITPKISAIDPACALIDIHGGALVFGGGRFAMIIGALRALSLSCKVLAVDYRMPPAFPYPHGLEDCLAAYRYLLGKHQPGKIAIAGLSAGGNLAAATVLRARAEGLPVPGALILLTPEVDLTESGDSFQTNQEIDVALPSGLAAANGLYAAGSDLRDPYLSPLFADFAGAWPPTYLQSGTRDLFLSNTVRMHRALLDAGHDAQLHVWEAMPHAGFGGAAPEDREMIASVKQFLKTKAGWA